RRDTMSPKPSRGAASQAPRSSAQLSRKSARRVRRRLRYISETFEQALPLLPIEAEGTPEGRASEWLLDNAHLLVESLEQLRTGLTASFLRDLPEAESGPLAGEPRVYGIARRLIEDEG